MTVTPRAPVGKLPVKLAKPSCLLWKLAGRTRLLRRKKEHPAEVRERQQVGTDRMLTRGKEAHGGGVFWLGDRRGLGGRVLICEMRGKGSANSEKRRAGQGC